jgi:hypothetical protein
MGCIGHNDLEKSEENRILLRSRNKRISEFRIIQSAGSNQIHFLTTENNAAKMRTMCRLL